METTNEQSVGQAHEEGQTGPVGSMAGSASEMPAMTAARELAAAAE